MVLGEMLLGISEVRQLLHHVGTSTRAQECHRDPNGRLSRPRTCHRPRTSRTNDRRSLVSGSLPVAPDRRWAPERNGQPRRMRADERGPTECGGQHEHPASPSPEDAQVGRILDGEWHITPNSKAPEGAGVPDWWPVSKRDTSGRPITSRLICAAGNGNCAE
jgi:hypothetical protein